MFYNGREVLSDHFQLILFWIPESSFCKKKNGIKWEERKEVPDLGKIPTFSRFVFGRRPLEFLFSSYFFQTITSLYRR